MTGCLAFVILAVCVTWLLAYAAFCGEGDA